METLIWGCLPFTKIFQFVCPLQKYFRSSSLFKIILGFLPFTKSFEVSSIYKNCGVTQTKCLRSSSLYKNIWGRLPFKNKFEVVFHIASSSLLAVFKAFALKNGLFQCRLARNMLISVWIVQILQNKPYFNLYSKFG